MVRKRYTTVLLTFLIAGGVGAKVFSAGEPQRNRVDPQQIIEAFAAKESEFFEAWKQYTYRQVATIQVLEVNGYETKNERMLLVSEIVFDDAGNREVQAVEKRGYLRNVTWTPEDEEVINNIQPFALTAEDLPLYRVKYEGRERVDELETYVFSVKPKSTKGDRLYFEGRIWVDEEDLQIVRTFGRAVPQKKNNLFPKFETLRQVVDDKYWFPAWTHADEVLDFGQNKIRIEETITYEDYKRFGSKTTIDFLPAKKPPKD
jgi:hypothetical protein